MFNNKSEMNISNRPKVRVYYEYNAKNEGFKLYERESFLDSWSYISTHPTLEEVQEAARARAITVIEMGLFENGHRKGMLSWFEEPRPVRLIPEASANFDYSEEVEFENKYIRKVSKPK